MILAAVLNGHVYIFNIFSVGASAWAGLDIAPNGNTTWVAPQTGDVYDINVSCRPQLDYIVIGNTTLENQTICDYSDQWLDLPLHSPQRSVHFNDINDVVLQSAHWRACTFHVNESRVAFLGGFWGVMDRSWKTLVPGGYNWTIHCVDRRPYIYWLGDAHHVVPGILRSDRWYQNGSWVYDFVPRDLYVNITWQRPNVSGGFEDVEERFLPGRWADIHWEGDVLVVDTPHPYTYVWVNASKEAPFVYKCEDWTDSCAGDWILVSSLRGPNWTWVRTDRAEAFWFRQTPLLLSVSSSAPPLAIGIYGEHPVCFRVWGMDRLVGHAFLEINGTVYTTGATGGVCLFLDSGWYEGRAFKKGYVPIYFKFQVSANISNLNHSEIGTPHQNGSLIVNWSLVLPIYYGDHLSLNYSYVLDGKRMEPSQHVELDVGRHVLEMNISGVYWRVIFEILPRRMLIQTENGRRFYALDAVKGRVLNVKWYWTCDGQGGIYEGDEWWMPSNAAHCEITVRKKGYIPVTVGFYRSRQPMPNVPARPKKICWPVVLGVVIWLSRGVLNNFGS